MKIHLVNAILILGTCCATYLYSKKFAAPSGQDLLMTAMADARKHLHDGARLAFINLAPSGKQSPSAIPYYPHFLHYALAPVRLITIPCPACDTALIISPAAAVASPPDSLVRGATIIWKHADRDYKYLLIAKPWRKTSSL